MDVAVGYLCYSQLSELHLTPGLQDQCQAGKFSRSPEGVLGPQEGTG